MRSFFTSKAGFIILFWLVLLGGILSYYQLPHIVGQEFTVAVQPVDPRDIFRGDYVTLSYDFSQFDPSLYTGVDAPAVGSTIFTKLKENNEGVYTAQSFSDDKPEGSIVLRGKVTDNWSGRTTVEYGIESFFVPEGQGKVIENIRNSERLKAVLAVDSWGRTVIKELLIDDESLDMQALGEVVTPQELERDRPFRNFENSIEIADQITEHVVTIPYDEDWTYEDRVLSHNSLSARWEVDVQEQEGARDGFDCRGEREKRGEDLITCGSQEYGWQSYQALEYLEAEKHFIILKRVASPVALQESGLKRITTVSISLKESEYAQLEEELKDMMAGMWMRDY